MTKPVVKPKISVADYVKQQIALGDKNQREIGEALGYSNPNIIALIKSGKSRIPLNQIGPMADVLNVNKAYFMKLVLAEYMPELYQSMNEVFFGGIEMPDENERELLGVIRQAAGKRPLNMSNDATRQALLDGVRKAIDADQTQAAASVKAYEAIPRSQR